MLRHAAILNLTILLLVGPVLVLPSAVHAITTERVIAPVGETGESLGNAVSEAGDVNGDGFGDVIVGAWTSDAGGNNAGRAYVLFGGPDMDDVPDLVLTGEAAFDRFGFSVAGAGDVNTDGFADVIVGAPSNGVGGIGAGRAYVFFGGLDADSLADVVITGTEGDELGHAVSAAGDINADGFADFLVGAKSNDFPASNAGAVYGFYGGPGLDSFADRWFSGEAQDDAFGSSVSGAGDVNGDGFDDVLVGAPGNDNSGVSAGAAYLFFGGPEMDVAADVVFEGEGDPDQFGRALSSAGDINGDGFADIIVGSSEGTVGRGRVYVFFGNPDGDTVADIVIVGEQNEHFGWALSGAGDTNADGYDDFMVGVVSADTGVHHDAGRADVFYGGAVPDTLADLRISGEDAFDGLGSAVSGAGDVNGDGIADVIVGAPSAGFAFSGRVYVYSGYPYRVNHPSAGSQWVAGQSVTVSWRGHDVADLEISFDGGGSWSTLAAGVGGELMNTFELTAPYHSTDFGKLRVVYSGQTASRSTSAASAGVFSIVTPHRPPGTAQIRRHFEGEAAGDQFGRAVSGAGDVNGDGFDDVLAGAWRNDAAGTEAGRAYVYYRGPGTDDVADLVLTGEAEGDWFGIAVSDAGDVNGDGFADFIVGAERNDAVGANAGRAYVYYGGPGADEVADWVFSGGDRLGHSVSGAGDVNGDGYDDVIVGAFLNDDGGADAGRASVFFGGPAADTVADLVFTGEAAGDKLGTSVSAAGDVNGDGYGDVLVGAANSGAVASDAGRAYIYLGGPAADEIPDLIVSGQVEDAFLGTSVADAGDVNGDGFGDVLIGAPGDLGSGRAYLFYGGPGLDDSADLVLVGDAGGDFFGFSVAGAGDVNDDGFDDVVVGSINAGDGGRASIYFGGPGADAVAEVVLESEADGDLFGVSVSGAGDTNGDGFADVAIGSQFSGPPSRAYLFDFNRYVVLSPTVSDLWNVGATQSISWLGAERADVWLSVDGGGRYSALATDVGGNASNTIAFTVPHQPTRYATIRVTPHASVTTGGASSDSLFTIEALIAMMRFAADPVEHGVRLWWETDPGPEDLAGYTIERAPAGDEDWRVLASMTRETSYVDRDAVPGRYRLTAINGLGEEFILGETALAPSVALAAWPLPYRGGDLTVRFATFGGLGGGTGSAEVLVFDVTGRLVRTIASGPYPAGQQMVVWDGRDATGHAVSDGVYFLRARSAGESTNLKLVVMR